MELQNEKSPYQTPLQSNGVRSVSPLTLSKAAAFVVAGGVVGGFLGGVVGAGLGVYVPDYYRGLFGQGVNPLQLGIGLGAVQGIGGGVLVAVVLIALFLWHQQRMVVLARSGMAEGPTADATGKPE